jgi:hypothetical protein
MIEDLKKYFETTPRKKVLENWAKSESFNDIGPTMDEFMQNTNMIGNKKEIASLISMWIREIIETDTLIETCKHLKTNLKEDQLLELFEICEGSDSINKILSAIDKYEYSIFTDQEQKDKDIKEYWEGIKEQQEAYKDFLGI